MKKKMRTIVMGAFVASFSGLVSCASTSTTAAPAASTSGGSAMRGVKPYTSDMCIVTDNKLGSMGDPITIVHEGQEVKFCCKPCVSKFKKNPGKYLANL